MHAAGMYGLIPARSMLGLRTAREVPPERCSGWAYWPCHHHKHSPSVRASATHHTAPVSAASRNQPLSARPASMPMAAHSAGLQPAQLINASDEHVHVCHPMKSFQESTGSWQSPSHGRPVLNEMYSMTTQCGIGVSIFMQGVS